MTWGADHAAASCEPCREAAQSSRGQNPSQLHRGGRGQGSRRSQEHCPRMAAPWFARVDGPKAISSLGSRVGEIPGESQTSEQATLSGRPNLLRSVSRSTSTGGRHRGLPAQDADQWCTDWPVSLLRNTHVSTREDGWVRRGCGRLTCPASKCCGSPRRAAVMNCTPLPAMPKRTYRKRASCSRDVSGWERYSTPKPRNSPRRNKHSRSEKCT